MSFIGVAFELSTSCPTCKHPLPLNGVSESVLCDGCRTPFQTPPSLWQSLLSDAAIEGIASEPDTGKQTTIFEGATFKLMSGRQDPRCNPICKTPFTQDQLTDGARTGSMACKTCGKPSKVRAAPEWMRSIHPRLTHLVGETTGGEWVTPEHGSVIFHCPHCGAALPLDGTTRSVACTYCNNTAAVPDDLWFRLHPVRTIDRWYTVFEFEGLEKPAGFLPAEVEASVDFCPVPEGNVIVAWLNICDDEEEAGHPARLGLVRPDGALLWKQDGIEFSAESRLFFSPATATVWLVDPSEDSAFAREIDPRTGEPIRTLRSPPDDSAGTLSVRDFRAFAIDPDGSMIVNREWSDKETCALRRFGPDGTRIPLWAGEPPKRTRPEERPRWPDLGDRPEMLPGDALICVGPDSTLWVADDDGGYIAKYQRDGQLLEVTPLPSNVVGRVHDIQAAANGVLFLLFEHKQSIDGDDWAHVARIDSGHQFQIELGAHVSDERLIDRYDERMQVLPDGTLFVGQHDSHFTNISLRGFSPERRLLFETNKARTRRQDDLKELAKARRSKHLAADREPVERQPGAVPASSGPALMFPLVPRPRPAPPPPERTGRANAVVWTLLLVAIAAFGYFWLGGGGR